MPKALSKLKEQHKLELTEAALLMRYRTTNFNEMTLKYATFSRIGKVLRLYPN